MVGLVKGRSPKRHDGVADVFVNDAAACHDDIGHCAEVVVEEVHEQFRGEFFRDGCEAANVGEEDGNWSFFSAEFEFVRVFEEFFDDFWGDVFAECFDDFAFLFAFGDEKVDDVANVRGENAQG